MDIAPGIFFFLDLTMYVASVRLCFVTTLVVGYKKKIRVRDSASLIRSRHVSVLNGKRTPFCTQSSPSALATGDWRLAKIAVL